MVVASLTIGTSLSGAERCKLHIVMASYTMSVGT